MSCIRFSPSASITPTKEGILLRSDLGTFQVTGADVGAFLDEMVPLLDGSRDREGLVEALPGYSPRSVRSLLDMLESHGLVERVPEAEARERFAGQEGFLRKWVKDAEGPTRRLAEARALMLGDGPWGRVAADRLVAAGVGAVDVASVAAEQGARALDEEDAMSAQGRFALLLVAVDPADAEGAERVARFAHRAKLVSLWSYRAGEQIVLGPLVVPGQTACRVCAMVEALNPGLTPPAEAIAGPRGEIMDELLGHLVAMEALKVLSGYTFSMLGGRMRIQDCASFASTLHTLVRLPWCRVCGAGV